MRSILIAVLWLTPSMALAQAPPDTDLLGPAGPHLNGPPTSDQSAFDKQPAEPEAAPWRAARAEGAMVDCGAAGLLGDAAHTGTGRAESANMKEPERPSRVAE
jgi:hypothetical protein